MIPMKDVLAGVRHSRFGQVPKVSRRTRAVIPGTSLFSAVAEKFQRFGEIAGGSQGFGCRFLSPLTSPSGFSSQMFRRRLPPILERGRLAFG